MIFCLQKHILSATLRKRILDSEWSLTLIRFCVIREGLVLQPVDVCCSLILWFVGLCQLGHSFSHHCGSPVLHKIGYDASEVSVGWCWVNIQAEDHVLWMLLTGKIWEFIAYVTLPVLYILIKIHIHNAVSPPWLIADSLTLQLSRGLHDIFINS